MTELVRDMRGELLDAAIERLKDAGLRVKELAQPPAADSGHDSLLQITGAAGSETYAVTIKARLSPASTMMIQPPHGGRLLIVAPYVSESVGESLRRQDIHYVDAAGNAYLTWKGMHIDIRGRRRRDVHRAGDLGKPLRAFRGNGLKILFVLLAEPTYVPANYRSIAHASGTSLGTVQWVLKELVGAGYVSADGDRNLYRRRELFNRWVEAYALDLYPRLTLATFDARDASWWTSADDAMRATDSQWGGETAVHRTYPRLRPSKAVVYAVRVPSPLASQYRFRRVPAAGNVEVRERFWKFDADPPDIVVPSPLVYADLVATGDPRQLEAAAYLREHDAVLRLIDSS